ncbi:MAG: hypothetical protein EWM72_02558 [Nitrospira sp.]|nr:MAG: hypothetical protein EWM72_02558 [Nitrospira sp.]
MNIYCDSLSSRPAWWFSLSLLDRLQICLRRLRVRAATVGFSLDCLATIFMNNPR